MEDKDFELSSMCVKVPKHLKNTFKQAVKQNTSYENVHEAITKFMIDTIGAYNKTLR